MKYVLLFSIGAILLIGGQANAYESLQEVFLNADSLNGYDRYMVLDPEVEYWGDLRIPAGISAFLDGQGAIIYRDDYIVSVGIDGHIDIQNCIFVGGKGAIYVGNQGSGIFRCNTITGCFEAGIRTYENNGPGLYIWDNIITNCSYGILVTEYYHPNYLDYNTIYDIETYRYAEYCPG